MNKTRLCDNCGQPTTAQARYCSQCGARLIDDLSPRADTGLLAPNHRLNGGRYRILRKLAQGGQSAVYLAMDESSGELRAVKELSESQVAPEDRVAIINDFLREANLLMQLRHPGLCQVFNTFFEEDRKPFLVMEYVIGHTLEDELVEHGRPLDWRRVGTWGVMVAEVLAFLHQQAPPVIHRDLKPANIMLTATGAIKVIDFGSARRQDALRRITTAYLGTEGYVPLEQYSGRSEPRSDLYALGASLYHLLTGYIPKPAPVRFVEGVALKPIRMVNPSVPDSIDRVIQQALQLDARERIADAVSMGQALVWACQRGAQVTGRPAPPRTGAP